MRSLRDWRIDKLLSGRELARAAGVTHKTLIDLELGRRTPTFATMRRISEVLGVAATDIAEFAASVERRRKRETS